MKVVSQRTVTLDDVIERHLVGLSEDYQQQASTQLRSIPTPGGVNSALLGDDVAADIDPCAEASNLLAVELVNLLNRYVDLLEAPDHGGWTLEEDNTTREVIEVLGRAGWTIKPRRRRG
jgi:hypothetical protein